MVMVVGLSAAAIAQLKPISGKVTDKDGRPIEGASVKVKGKQGGTAANAEGSFTVTAKPGDVLVISSIGFEDVIVKVGAAGTIKVSLTPKAQEASSEVVVTAYGIKRQAKEVGYSTQKINAEELTQAHVTNAATGLTGKVSGLQIQTTNNGVNPDVKINLRGNRSILGNNQALLVVDGAIVPSAYLSSINPDDIDNFQIIKGSAGSVLYGSDGSNGVLVVTTKKDTKGKLVVKYSSNIQFERVSIMPDLQTDYGSYGGEGGSYIDALTGKAKYVPFENQSFGPKYDGSMVALGTPKRIYRADGSFFDSTLMRKYSGLKNAKRDFWHKGFTTQNNVSLAGGDEKSSVFVGLQNVYTEGVVPNDMYKRNNGNINGFRDFGTFKVEYSAAYTQSNVNIAGPGFFQSRPLYFAVLNTPAHIDLRDFQNTSDPNSFGHVNNYFNAYYPNPWWQINNSRITDRDEYLIGNLNFSAKVTDWLDASYRIGYTSHENMYKSTINGVQYSAYEISDPYGVSNLAASVKKTNASMNEGNVFGSKLTGDLLVTAHKKFKDLSTRLILGQNFQSDYLKFLGIGATALNFNDFYNIGTRIGNPTAFESYFQRNIQGAFADATVGYKGYLFVHGAFRKSWYSNLAPENREFNFGSGDVSFVLSDAFANTFSNSIVNFLKVRVAHGVTGNVSLDNLTPFGAYNVANAFNPAGGFPYGNTSGFSLNTTNNNRNIKPEMTTESEFGVEVGLLKNRINFTGAIYKQNTTNQTLPSQVSWATGFNQTLINQGETQNIGVETDLKFTPLLDTRSGLRWDFGFNFNYIENKVVSLPGGADINLGNVSYAIVGKPYPSLKVYDWNRDAATGKVIVDENGDPSRGSKLVNVGSSFNPYRIGFNTTLSYKGFSLASVVDYRGGGIIFNAIGQDLDFSGISAHSTYGNREKFVFPNSVYDDGTGKYVSNKTKTISNVYNFWSGNINRVGTPYVTSASFWKLREVSLSYKITDKVLGYTKIIKGATISVFGRNLLTFRPKENIWTDPEFNNDVSKEPNDFTQSFNNSGYTTANQTPPTRFWGFNLALNF